MFDNYSFVYRASAIFVGVYEPTKQKLLKMFPENLSALAHFVRETCLFLYLCFMYSPWEHDDWVVWEVYSAYCLMYEGLWQYKQLLLSASGCSFMTLIKPQKHFDACFLGSVFLYISHYLKLWFIIYISHNNTII